MDNCHIWIIVEKMHSVSHMDNCHIWIIVLLLLLFITIISYNLLEKRNAS